MCGIVGLIGKTPLDFKERCNVQLLCDALIHRGPDGDGSYSAPQFMMAMRRLSIIDLGGGWQPLYNEDRSIALVANGEVYNFIELRAELESRGHQFHTKSDCETIIHLYEEIGDEVVNRLRGMYSFALYDTRNERALIVRDRMGEKPLYIAEQPNGRIYFSSELRAMIRAGVVPFDLDPIAVYEYFHYNYIPEPRCAVKGVRKLPPGHLLAVDFRSGDVQERAYWKIEDAPPIEGDPAQIIRAEFERVNELIVRSDVPVGIALSSGVDSSAIAALAQQKFPGLLTGITVGYEGAPRQDERVASKQFADYIKLPLHRVELRDAEVIDGFPEMVLLRDDPIADISGSGYLSVMRAAHEKGLRVMLMGHGGDELFWGYWWVREALWRSHLKAGLHTSPPTTSRRDYMHMSKPPRSIPMGLRWLRNGGGLLSGRRDYVNDLTSSPDRLVHYDHSFEFDRAAHLLPRIATRSYLEQMANHDLRARYASKLPWKHLDVEIAKHICSTYLLENGLAQGDRLSMAASVELRTPLVDYRFVETVFGLMKTHSTVRPEPKKWFREAVKDLVPEFVMNRPKTGFNAPWRRWIPGMFDRFGHMVEDGELVRSGILRRGSAPRAAGLLALTLEVWCRQMRSFGAFKPADLSGVANLSTRVRRAS
jgi:asparagine synthase (glutamine-hydrolysing)